MPQPRNQPHDPEIQAELDAIDATLRGEAVHPVYAELAELALLLELERPPAPREEFLRELDARAARNFRPDRGAGSASARADRERHGRAGSAPQRGRRVSLFRRPVVVSVVVPVLVAAVIAVIVIASVGSQQSLTANSAGGAGASSSVGSGAPVYGKAGSSASASGSSSTSGASGSGRKQTPEHLGKVTHAAAAVNGAATSSSSGPAASSSPAASGRRVEQSTQVQLSTSNGHIENVSQEVFDVVAQENGIVERSHVSAASGNAGGSYASFTLSIPDGNLQAAMDRLSALRYANVVSREQSTEDVTSQYRDDQRALADARALRASLLKQLEQAVTTGEIDSLKAQIQGAETSIHNDENRISRLDHATSYSTVAVAINARNVVPTPVRSSTGFSIGRGAHDALRVLVVVAGVALIVLAALIPAGLLVALLAWIGFKMRQRRREQALDQA